ncbi:Uncharacterized protein Fot_08967 [Forsythia ovata]|uniref:Uncharacterized protein n=1 Tax=Forsythia ovata TaxID=205694 RepID=A0ABD1WCN9_9LAMI
METWSVVKVVLEVPAEIQMSTLFTPDFCFRKASSHAKKRFKEAFVLCRLLVLAGVGIIIIHGLIPVNQTFSLLNSVKDIPENICSYSMAAMIQSDFLRDEISN